MSSWVSEVTSKVMYEGALGAFDGGDLEAQVDHVRGLVLDEILQAGEEALVAELARDLDAGPGGDVAQLFLGIGAGLEGVGPLVLAGGLLLDGAEDLPFPFDPPDGVHGRERDGAGGADVAAGGATDGAVHRVYLDGDPVLHLVHVPPPQVT